MIEAEPAPVTGIDPASETRRIVERLRVQLGEVLRRRGFVVAMSGGVDSSVCAALAVEAVGPGRVLGLALPERDSDPESLELARSWASELGIAFEVEEITPVLDACGCYRRRDEAVRRLVPEYGAGWGCKLVLPAEGAGAGRLNVYHLVVRSPSGEERSIRLPSVEYREIVAATNFKQRVRKMLEYHHADRLHYAVVGTPNRLEYDQGFFVKGGDGLADVKPIAHLYKSEVYRLAEHLGVPPGIVGRPPTTDTYSLPQGQDEFYFRYPTALLDRILQVRDRGLDAESAAAELGLGVDEVRRAFDEVDRKRRAAFYGHCPALLVEEVAGAADARGLDG